MSPFKLTMSPFKLTMSKYAFIFLSFFASALAFAESPYIYKSPNKIDFVKLTHANKDEKAGGLKHPYTFTDNQVRTILTSLHFNRNVLLEKNIRDRQLLNERSIETLIPYFVQAFQKVKSDEVVVVSFFTKNATFGVQDDRLSVFRAYTQEDGLHLKFSKVYAKMLGDRTTMGAEKAANEARSFRVSLELQPGQNRISHDPEELVLDLSYFSPEGIKEAALKKVLVEEKKSVLSKKVSEKPKTVRERLKELDDLKKDELITEKEYQKKRRDLLDQL